LQGKTKTLSGSRASAVSALLRETARASSYKRHLYGASRASTLLLIAFPNGLGQSKKMEPEHLYQWLICFVKTSSKSNWEKNELVDAIRDQYVELMKKVGELPPKKQPS